MDVEATRAIRQAEVGAARTMIERSKERLELCCERVVADSAYGTVEMLGWLVDEQGDRTAHFGIRQIGPYRRHVLARRLRL